MDCWLLVEYDPDEDFFSEGGFGVAGTHESLLAFNIMKVKFRAKTCSSTHGISSKYIF